MQIPIRTTAIAAVLQQLPPVQHALAYGSGVLHQPGLYADSGPASSSAQSSARPMIDYILAVEDPFKWHAQV
jgi:translocator assembly and maintenance protein 41